MLIGLGEKYPDIITDIFVKRFREERGSYELLAVITLIDSSEIHLKEYLFSNGTQKYAYHWQTKDRKLIRRWDNAPHWPTARSYPHHYHMDTGTVKESTVRTMNDMMEQVSLLFL